MLHCWYGQWSSFLICLLLFLGSGGSSSITSSPRLRNGWLRPTSPVRVPPSGGTPRSRFSLYEAPRNTLSTSQAPKDRHSVCVEPRGLNADLTGSSSSGFRRRPQAVDGSRGLLRLNPRNPLLDLLDPTPLYSSTTTTCTHYSSSTASSTAVTDSTPLPIPRKSFPSMTNSKETDQIDSSPRRSRDHHNHSSNPPSSNSIQSSQHPPSQNVAALNRPRSRTNLALFRHSGLFQ